MKFAFILPIVLASAVAAAAQTASSSNPLGSLKAEKVSKVVVSNVDTVIDYSFILNPDCTLGGVTQHRILKKPMHGEIVIAEGDQYPNFQPPNVRVDCNSKKIRAAEIHYKAADGFTGVDNVDIVTIYPDGSADRTVYEIIVG